MIRPEEYEGAVTGLRFLCGATSMGRQYTFVEITTADRTDRDVAVSFCVPDGRRARDERVLLEALGGSPVNEAMDAWGECRTESMLRAISSSVAFESAPSTLSAEVSGCTTVATVVLPTGGECAVTACWSHDVGQSESLMVPTFNENLTGWRVDAILMHGDSHNHGRAPKHAFARAFRHDLAAAPLAASGSGPFLPTDKATLLRRWGPSLPYHNLHVPLSPPSDPRIYRSLCGAVLRDCTSRSMMTFYDVMFVAIPAVCGAYIRNSLSYPRCHVPLTISERLCRRRPVEFRDAADGSPGVDVCIEGVPVYRVDPSKRAVHETLHWVELIRLSDVQSMQE